MCRHIRTDDDVAGLERTLKSSWEAVEHHPLRSRARRTVRRPDRSATGRRAEAPTGSSSRADPSVAAGGPDRGQLPGLGTLLGASSQCVGPHDDGASVTKMRFRCHER